MKYLIILATSLALVMPPVFAADAAPAPGPVKKGNLMLAKKKDHSKAAEKPAKKAEKKAEKKTKK
jgi:opacity protein-like surface antigen